MSRQLNLKVLDPKGKTRRETQRVLRKLTTNTYCAVMVVATLLLTSFVSLPSRAGAANLQPAGGVVLDGWGGLHPFGGVTINAANAPYWHGWDIARSVVVLPDGSGGWTLDGWGGIHAWGSAAPIASPAYWRGWDIARALVVLPDGRSGYVLDGYGGVHPFGSAPGLTGFPYWPGWDIARGLDLHYDAAGIPDGGWTLDGWGSIHNFGNAPYLPSPHYYKGFDFWQRLHVTGNGAGALLVGRYGIVDTSGNPNGISWSSFPNWGSWDIVRDVVPMNPSGSPIPQPVDRQALGSLLVRLMNWDRAAQGAAPLAETATLDNIEGYYDGYNLAGCGGPNVIVGDRTADMASRNYFDHAIAGCSGTRYVFDTYLPNWGISYTRAAENIGWSGSSTSLSDMTWFINSAYMQSPEHYRNIMGPYSQVGCGQAYVGPGQTWQGHTGPLLISACVFIA